MNTPAFPPISTGFSWTPPTTNTDGSPIAAGELTGYDIGIRADGTGAAGTYAIVTNVADPTATQEPLAKLGTVLAPGNYWAAIRADAAADSAWSSEVPFSIVAPPPPTPNPPSGFSAS